MAVETSKLCLASPRSCVCAETLVFESSSKRKASAVYAIRLYVLCPPSALTTLPRFEAIMKPVPRLARLQPRKCSILWMTRSQGTTHLTAEDESLWNRLGWVSWCLRMAIHYLALNVLSLGSSGFHMMCNSQLVFHIVLLNVKSSYVTWYRVKPLYDLVLCALLVCSC